jgi:hypothetical protein
LLLNNLNFYRLLPALDLHFKRKQYTHFMFASRPEEPAKAFLIRIILNCLPEALEVLLELPEAVPPQRG